MTTDSDQTWKTIPGFSKYEVSTDGFGPDQQPVRRAGTGKQLATRPGSSGYLLAKIYDDEGKQQTRTIHSLVLLTYAGPRPEGMEARHLDDDPFNNRWRPGDEAEARAAGGNLIWGTKAANVEDTFSNGRPRAVPRPERRCVLCDAVLTTNGKRCHECVVRLGVAAAGLLKDGHDPAIVAEALDYPSAEGISKLAIVHGGYGQAPEAPTAGRPGWRQRVAATVRHLFGRADRSHGK